MPPHSAWIPAYMRNFNTRSTQKKTVRHNNARFDTEIHGQSWLTIPTAVFNICRWIPDKSIKQSSFQEPACKYVDGILVYIMTSGIINLLICNCSYCNKNWFNVNKSKCCTNIALFMLIYLCIKITIRENSKLCSRKCDISNIWNKQKYSFVKWTYGYINQTVSADDTMHLG